MDIKELQHNWDTMGKHDPLWAILTNPGKKGGRWDVQEFFVSGEHKIEKVLSDLDAAGISFPKGRALDFGCGVGRLTQPLCKYFKQVCGVDIAPSMIEQANRFNRHPESCTYHLNDKEDLSLFATGNFDFIYTCIVLQHMQPGYAKSYIHEFIRLLSPQGIAVFQLPTGKSPGVKLSAGQRIKATVKSVTPTFLWKLARKANGVDGAEMEMYSIPRAEVEAFVQQNGARIVNVTEDKSTGVGWEGLQYTIQRT